MRNDIRSVVSSPNYVFRGTTPFLTPPPPPAATAQHSTARMLIQPLACPNAPFPMQLPMHMPVEEWRLLSLYH